MAVRYARWMAALALATSVAGTPAMAGVSGGDFIGFGDVDDAPTGFVEMCDRDPATCQQTGAVAASGLAGPALDRLARAVNRHVNMRTVQRTDSVQFGIDELWRRAGTGTNATGDCEDIALEKLAELTARGFPRDRLFLATVFKSRVGLHTVLIARLDRGDVVLDSLTGRVERWNKARYSWLRVQSMRDPREWHRPASV